MPLVLGGLLVPGLVLFGALVLLGLSQSHTATQGSGGLSGWWHGLWSYLGHGGFPGQLLDWARSIVSHFAAAQLRMVAGFFLDLGTLELGIFLQRAAFAEAVAGAIENLWTHGDSKARTAAKQAGANAKTAQRTATTARSDAHAAHAYAGTVAHSLNRYKARTNTRLHTLTHATTIALPHDIGQIKAREKVLEGEYTDLWKRTKAIEDGAVKTWDWIKAHPVGVAATAFAGAVAIALDRLGFGWIRCPGVGRVGNAVCGLPANLLEDLLGLLADYFILTNICDLLPILETVASDVGTPLVEALTTVGAGLCSGAEKAPPLGLPALILPAVYYTGNLTLPA